VAFRLPIDLRFSKSVTRYMGDLYATVLAEESRFYLRPLLFALLDRSMLRVLCRHGVQRSPPAGIHEHNRTRVCWIRQSPSR
jgi:hypothetical protein